MTTNHKRSQQNPRQDQLNTSTAPLSRQVNYKSTSPALVQHYIKDKGFSGNITNEADKNSQESDGRCEQLRRVDYKEKQLKRYNISETTSLKGRCLDAQYKESSRIDKCLCTKVALASHGARLRMGIHYLLRPDCSSVGWLRRCRRCVLVHVYKA